MKTIRILGAGPAGLMAGIQLARNGYSVEIHEKRVEVGQRHHNDFQGLENWSQKDDVLQMLRSLGLETDFFARPFNGGTLYLPSLRPVEVHSPAPMFYLIKRGPEKDTLDSSLKRQALNAGVRIHFKSDQSVDADIIATGPRRANMVAAGITFETSLQDQAMGILSDTLAPKGYAYFLVADGEATLATVLFRHFHKASACLKESLKAFQQIVGFEMKHPRKFGGYGYFGCPRSALREGKHYVGEAIGFQDFLFGFGIRYALLSGYWAAQSILSGSNYDVLWKRSFEKPMMNSVVDRFLYERFGKIAYYTLSLILGRTQNARKSMNLLYATPFPHTLYPLVSHATRRFYGRGRLSKEVQR